MYFIYAFLDWLCLSGGTKTKMGITNAVLMSHPLYQRCSRSSHVLSHDIFINIIVTDILSWKLDA